MSRNLRCFVDAMGSRLSNGLKFAKSKVLKTSNVSPCTNETTTLVKNHENLKYLSDYSKTITRSTCDKMESSFSRFSLLYDKITGRDSVRIAGAEVLQSEQQFVENQLRRRTTQKSLFEVQKKRSEISKQLDFISRADENFLPLITREHELAREEAELMIRHNDADDQERASYEKFASLLRYLHAEERNYDMRMRQWALIGSVALSLLSAIITWLRFRSPKIELDRRDEEMNAINRLFEIQKEIDVGIKSIPGQVCAEMKNYLVNKPNSQPSIDNSTFLVCLATGSAFAVIGYFLGR